MSSDPIKNILRILYDDLTSRVYCIIKSTKKIRRAELELKLRESGIIINDSQFLNSALFNLEKENFIRTKKEKIEREPGDAPRLYQKGHNKTESYSFNNININILSNKYNEMKKNLKENLKQREERKYKCPICQVEKNENFASRDNYKCPNCQKDYIKSAEDISEINRRCEIILEFLDKLFKEEENNASTGINNYYKNYLSSKYGKNYNNDNKVKDTFEEDHDSYICETLDHLNDKLKFYELVEGYIRAKKK